MSKQPLSHRLAYRVGMMEARGWPWQRADRDLMREAADDIEKLERAVVDLAGKFCPRPANASPADTTIAECIRQGECGRINRDLHETIRGLCR